MRSLLAKARERHRRRVRALRGRERIRRLRALVPGDAGRRRLGSQRAQALDHERGRSRALHRLRHRRSDAGYKGISAFLVDRDVDGFSVGKKEDKLGIRASSTTELVFEDVRLSSDLVLGEVGKGYKVAIETLNEGRIGIGAQMLGLAQGALDHTVRYVREREQFGRSIGSFQGVQFQLAEMATEIAASRLLVYNAARLKDAGRPFLVPAAMAKLYASESAQRVASTCIDLHGGYGFTKEYRGEAVSRREDRHDLRGDVQHAEADDRAQRPDRLVVEAESLRDPGPDAWVKTSDARAIRCNTSSPSSLFRSRMMLFLPRLADRYRALSLPQNGGPHALARSPPGGSILMTVAPRSARIWLQYGPARFWVRSQTVMSWRGAVTRMPHGRWERPTCVGGSCGARRPSTRRDGVTPLTAYRVGWILAWALSLSSRDTRRSRFAIPASSRPCASSSSRAPDRSCTGRL